MFLMLHVTCSYIIHAYVPPFSIFFILIVLVLFYFSLFLSVICSMAPKRKLTLSRNPFHFGTSSSNSTPLHVRFCDDKARKDFSENFSRRSIHSKHQVILSDFSDADLPTVIHSRGRESLCDVLIICPFVIILEFYYNMHDFDNYIPLFITHIRGKRIVVTLDLISKVLHVLKVAHPNYPSCDRLNIVSKDELMSLFCETPSFWVVVKTPVARPLLKIRGFLKW